ncbi:hypothetical protein [Roseinatronobacter alkalisoli]|nr:hypothetical protein [Roseinatronobacter sp. HJB301]
MTTDREAYFFWGTIFGTALLITLLHNLSAQGADRATDWGRFAFHVAVFAVLLMPGWLQQTHNPATAEGPRKARRYLLFILGLLPLMSLYLRFPGAAQGLTLLQLFDELSLTLIMLAALSTIWLWWFGPMLWRHPQMRRVLIKEFGSVFGAALGLAVFFGVMKGWPAPQVIWVWLFMIGLIGNAIMPMTLPRKHGASDLARVTLLVGEWMSITAFVSIIHLLLSSEADPAPGLIGTALGMALLVVTVHYTNKNSSKPPAYTRRL